MSSSSWVLRSLFILPSWHFCLLFFIYFHLWRENLALLNINSVMRAIGVSHAACKDVFRQNLRSHSWSVVSFLLHINSSRVADTNSPGGLAFTGLFGLTGFFHADLLARLASFIQTASFFQVIGPTCFLPFTDLLARLARAAFWLTSPLSTRPKTY